MSRYYHIKNYFDNYADLVARTEKGPVKDKIYKACFESHFEAQYDKIDIRIALRENWIKKDKILDKGTVRNIYIWLDEEVGQRRLLPKIIEKIERFFFNYIYSPAMRFVDNFIK